MALYQSSCNKAAIYLRLSREDGDKMESDSIRNQRELLRGFIRQHAGLVLVDEYVDDGYSGTNFDRPDFKRMMDDVQAKRINCIIVKDLSRLGRNYIETGRYLERIFPFIGVRFIAVTDNYDSQSDEGDANQIVIPFKNLINDAYCRDISIKIRSQFDVKRKNGDFIGSFAAYGYLKNPRNHSKLVVDEYAGEIVKMIFALRLDGISPGRIAQKLNELGVLPPAEYKRMLGYNFNNGFKPKDGTSKWEIVTVRRILADEIYTGVMVQGRRRKINYKVKKSIPLDESEWVRVEGTHEAIVTKEAFRTVQKLALLDTRTAPDAKTVHPLSGMVRCAECGQNMVLRSAYKAGRKYFYYTCSSYKNGLGCTAHLINREKLEQVVVESINRQIALLMDAEAILRDIDTLPHERIGVKTLVKQSEALRMEIDRCKKLSIHLYQDKVDGLLDDAEYRNMHQHFQEKKDAAEAQLAELENRIAGIASERVQLSPWIEEFRQYRNIESADRKMLVSVLDHVEVCAKNEIRLVFRHKDKMQELLECAGLSSSEGSEVAV